VESYSTEEEQVEALRRWWNENGRSTIVAIVLALGLGFGYQGWKGYKVDNNEAASDVYQRMLQAFGAPALSPEQEEIAIQLAVQLKADYSGSTYAQFASLQLARVAVAQNNLAEAQAELRWVLGKADKGSDVARIAQLRLARILAASGEPDQALSILDQGGEGPYKASYAVARGDLYLSLDRAEEASAAYASALAFAAGEDAAGIDLVAVEQKLQALNPRPARLTVSLAGGEATNTEETVEIIDAVSADSAGAVDDTTTGAEE
jgi:predicted negative regulator of RcsB-dependent stress response